MKQPVFVLALNDVDDVEIGEYVPCHEESVVCNNNITAC